MVSKRHRKKKKSSKIFKQKLDFCPLPDSKLKTKIDYFMTPYNNKIIHEKHMTFDSAEQELKKLDESYDFSNYTKWKQIREFIFDKDVELLNKTLHSVNEGLVRALESHHPIELKQKKCKKKNARIPIWMKNNRTPSVLSKFKVKNRSLNPIGKHQTLPRENLSCTMSTADSGISTPKNKFSFRPSTFVKSENRKNCNLSCFPKEI